MTPSIFKRMLFFGSSRFCPVCGHYAGKFDRHGTDKRRDARCIYCDSLERHRLAWLYLTEKTDLFSGSRKLLHIAPDPCLENRFRQLLGPTYITADQNDPDANVRMDITEIPFGDGNFDVIVCSHALEHVADDRKSFREFHRVLKKDGWALIMVPIRSGKTIEDPRETDPQQRLQRFGHPDHVRCYGLDIVDRIKKAGFRVHTVAEKDLLTAGQMYIYGIRIHTPLFVCEKG